MVPTPWDGREGKAGETAVPAAASPSLSPHVCRPAVPRARRPGGCVPLLGWRGEGARGLPHEPPLGLQAASLPGLPLRRPARCQRLGLAHEAARPRGEGPGRGAGGPISGCAGGGAGGWGPVLLGPM